MLHFQHFLLDPTLVHYPISLFVMVYLEKLEQMEFLLVFQLTVYYAAVLRQKESFTFQLFELKLLPYLLQLSLLRMLGLISVLCKLYVLFPSIILFHVCFLRIFLVLKVKFFYLNEIPVWKME